MILLCSALQLNAAGEYSEVMANRLTACASPSNLTVELTNGICDATSCASVDSTFTNALESCYGVTGSAAVQHVCAGQKPDSTAALKYVFYANQNLADGCPANQDATNCRAVCGCIFKDVAGKCYGSGDRLADGSRVEDSFTDFGKNGMAITVGKDAVACGDALGKPQGASTAHLPADFDIGAGLGAMECGCNNGVTGASIVNGRCGCGGGEVLVATPGAPAVTKCSSKNAAPMKCDFTKTAGAAATNVICSADGVTSLSNTVDEVCQNLAAGTPGVFSYYTLPTGASRYAVCVCSVLSKAGSACISAAPGLGDSFGITNEVQSAGANPCATGGADDDLVDVSLPVQGAQWGYSKNGTITQMTQMRPKQCRTISLVDVSGAKVELSNIPQNCKGVDGFASKDCTANALCNGTLTAEESASYDLLISTASQFAAKCVCRLTGIDGRCLPHPKTCASQALTHECPKETYQTKEACGSDSTLQPYSFAGFQQYSRNGGVQCACDWAAGAVLHPFTQRCISASLCIQTTGASVDYDTKTCGCGAMPFFLDPDASSGFACADASNRRDPAAWCQAGRYKFWNGTCCLVGAGYSAYVGKTAFKDLQGAPACNGTANGRGYFFTYKLEDEAGAEYAPSLLNTLQSCRCLEGYVVAPAQVQCRQKPTEAQLQATDLQLDGKGNVTCKNADLAYTAATFSSTIAGGKCTSRCSQEGVATDGSGDTVYGIRMKRNDVWMCLQVCHGPKKYAGITGGAYEPDPFNADVAAILSSCSVGDAVERSDGKVLIVSFQGTAALVDPADPETVADGCVAGASTTVINVQLTLSSKKCTCASGYVFDLTSESCESFDSEVVSTFPTEPERYNKTQFGMVGGTPGGSEYSEALGFLPKVYYGSDPMTQGTALTKLAVFYRNLDNEPELIQAPVTPCIASLCLNREIADMREALHQKVVSACKQAGGVLTSQRTSDDIPVYMGELRCGCAQGYVIQEKPGAETVCQQKPCDSGYHVDEDAQLTLLSIDSRKCVKNDQRCTTPGFVINFNQTECVQADACGEKAVVNPTADAAAWLSCACEGGNTYGVLSADVSVMKCSDSCGTMPFEYYLEDTVKHCGAARHPEAGWLCENLPAPKLKTWNGGCVELECLSLTGGCLGASAAVAAQKQTQCNVGSSYDKLAAVTSPKTDKDYFWGCTCQANYIVDLDGSKCIETSVCTATRKGAVQVYSKLGLQNVNACQCTGRPYRAMVCQANNCMLNCRCPVGTVAKFDGSCQTYAEAVTICGANTYIPTLSLQEVYYKCRCTNEAPLVQRSLVRGCITACGNAEPASTNEMGNRICPQATTGTCKDPSDMSRCVCNYDAGMYNKDGICAQCPKTNGLGLVKFAMNECHDPSMTVCDAGFVLNNTQSLWCISVAHCQSTTGTDGLERVVSLNGDKCIERSECTGARKGVVLNGYCICGRGDGSLPFVTRGQIPECVGADYELSVNDNLACPYGRYLSFGRKCIKCPAEGCAAGQDARKECGPNTQFVLAYSTASTTRCACALDGRRLWIMPDLKGCIASCFERDGMVEETLFTVDDKCACNNDPETNSYRPGEAKCSADCGQYSFTHDVKERKLCADVCNDLFDPKQCHCEPDMVLTFNGQCSRCPQNEKGERDCTRADLLCGQNSLVDPATGHCKCKENYMVMVNFMGCILNANCVASGNILNKYWPYASHCISPSSCTSAISLNNDYCVESDFLEGPKCGTDAYVVSGKCQCADPQKPFVERYGLGCVAKCDPGQSFVLSTKQCYAQGKCFGNCVCPDGQVMMFDASCQEAVYAQTAAEVEEEEEKELIPTNECGVLGATVVKVNDYFQCQCPESAPYASFQGETKECALYCPDNAPYQEKVIGIRTCATTACLDPTSCKCHYEYGRYNHLGACTDCQDSYVSSNHLCLREAVCSENEVALGRYCQPVEVCIRAEKFIDVSGTMCVKECGAGEVPAEGYCKCGSKHRVSKDGFYCEAMRLSKGAIAGVTVGVVVIIGVVLAVVTVVVRRRQGKCGQKKPAARRGKLKNKSKDNLSKAGADDGKKHQ